MSDARSSSVARSPLQRRYVALPEISQRAGSASLEGTIRSRGPLGGLPFEVWDVRETISRLAYLTHNHFRYYGKFPSTVAAGLLNRFAQGHSSVIDNYCGSGTTLVESTLRGLPSVGIDLNPFAVLAARVKTHAYDQAELKAAAQRLLSRLVNKCSGRAGRHSAPLFANLSDDEASHGRDRPELKKWFTQVVQADLERIKGELLMLPDGWIRQFFLLAFFAIIRRVSVAYDGEVRPHVNPDKKPRDVYSAFRKKVTDMLERADAFHDSLPHIPNVEVVQGCARRLGQIEGLRGRLFDFCISHPPYLNCFDYLPVYKLEFLWASGVSELEGAGSYGRLRDEEVRSWPATSEEAREQYFAANLDVYKSLRPTIRRGGTVCVVIGDATVHKKLIRVHEHFAELLQRAGFQMQRVIYRTTHYGTGKYSYEDRADYHVDGEGHDWSHLDTDPGKRDALLIAKAV